VAETTAALAAVAGASIPPAGTTSSDWFMDTRVTLHVASTPGITHSHSPLASTPLPPFINVGNGDQLHVTHLARTHLSSFSEPMYNTNKYTFDDLNDQYIMMLLSSICCFIHRNHNPTQVGSHSDPAPPPEALRRCPDHDAPRPPPVRAR
jgi:hypothetical protein